MAEANNPLIPIRDIVVKLRNKLLDLIRNVFNKIKPLIRNILKFLNRLKSQAKALIGAIGKTAFNKITMLANRLTSNFPILQKMVQNALKIADQILAFIKKTADPNKAIKAVKKLVTRLVKTFRVIVKWVKDLFEIMNPLGAVLGIVSKFVMVLRIMISWISDVTGVQNAVKKVLSALRKIMKVLFAGLKEATQLAKEAGKLKPA
jgi:phage-related protein